MGSSAKAGAGSVAGQAGLAGSAAGAVATGSASLGVTAELGATADDASEKNSTENNLGDNDACEDSVTGRALRMLQLHDDARQEFERAEEKLKSVRDTFDRVLAGDVCEVEEPPVAGQDVEVVAFVPLPVARKRSPYIAAAVALAALGILGGLVMSVVEATRDPDSVASRGAIVSEAVAAAVVVREDGTQMSVAADQVDFGRTIYAERFANAPPAERMCLARAIYYEARGEDMGGQIAVAQVVLNRARSKKWPNTICGVVNQGVARGEKCQFSYACFTHLNQPAGPMWDQAQLVADQVLQGQAWLRELVEATYYHTVSVAPVWRTSLTEITTIGTHIFYRDGDGLRVSASDAQAYQAAANAQDARAKDTSVNKAARPKSLIGEAPPKKASPERGGDWKATVFSQ